MKRAITLAGGGPAAGLHIGVLEHFKKHDITFDIWALSCIGAWVGIVYNQCEEGREVEQTYDFFRDVVFRNDASYDKFPINSVFGADSFGNAEAVMNFWSDPESYKNLFLPAEIMKSTQETWALMCSPERWTRGDINNWILNHVMAPNPIVRFWTSTMFKSNITGLAKLYYPDSAFMKAIKFEKLYEDGKPFIFHNAWNLSKQELALFANRPVENAEYRPIIPASLCACSALPYIEETVELDGDTYCEGALVDTVNFKRLIQDHHKPDNGDGLDEIWVSRIIDDGQIRPPQNLHDSLANLCQLFAATVGEDDVKLFKYHVEEKKNWSGTIVEIGVPSEINFDWSHANLENGRKLGRAAAQIAHEKYKKAIKGRKKKEGELLCIEMDVEADEVKKLADTARSSGPPAQ